MREVCPRMRKNSSVPFTDPLLNLDLRLSLFKDMVVDKFQIEAPSEREVS